MNTTPRLFRAPGIPGDLGQTGGSSVTAAASTLSPALAALGPIGAGIGILQTGLGIVQGITAKAKMKRLLGQQKAYKTPKELWDVLNATQNNMGGMDAASLEYYTNQNNQAFSSSLGAAQRLGVDPNHLSAIFHQNVNAIAGVTKMNHEAYMQNFSNYIGAKKDIAASMAAEQKSQQDILNSKMQAAGANMQAGTGNVSGGINTLLATLSAERMSKLYNTDGSLKKQVV